MVPATFVFLVDEFGDVLFFFVGSIPPGAEISVLCLVCVVFVAPWRKPRRCGGELYFWCVAFYHSAYCFVGSYLRSAVPD